MIWSPKQGTQLGRAARVVAILAAGTVSALIFRALRLPLPWTLGAMASAALLTLAGPRWALPLAFRDGARPVIGVMAGSAFSPAVIQQLANWWLIPLILVGLFLVLTAAGQVFFRRVCGFDKATALFASMPGGLGEMTLMGAQFGADVRKLALVHSVRIVIVVIAVPILIALPTSTTVRTGGLAGTGMPDLFDWLSLSICAFGGYFIGRRFRAFGGLMLVPMLLSALVHGSGLAEAAPPGWLVAAMQVVIGSITGARFAGTRLSEIRVALVQGLGWTAVLLALSAAAAALAAIMLNKPVTALFLALSPGGFAEMSIIAIAMQIEVAFVVACHAFRTLFIITAAPMLCRLWLRPPD